jgi:YegS/Rv2252/BmrU family lipid kinase
MFVAVKPFLVVNPASAGGRTGRHFDAIARAVRAAVGDFECAFTRARGDGVRLAREAVASGGDFVVAVGGDGTASEVIDGLANGHGDSGVLFGYIPRGTGGDLRRTIQVPGDVEGAARVLAGSGTALIDLGRVELVGSDGRPAVRHFANVAGCGISGVVVQEVQRSPGFLGGRLAFKLAALRALLRYSDRPVRWRVDGGPWTEQRVTAISACNGRFFGGGMMVAPDARMDDGLLDVVVWSGLGLSDFVMKQPMLYGGTHVQLPNTRVVRARVLEVEPTGDVPVLLDVDGEQPGMLPARFEILPRALRVRVA